MNKTDCDGCRYLNRLANEQAAEIKLLRRALSDILDTQIRDATTGEGHAECLAIAHATLAETEGEGRVNDRTDATRSV